MRNSRIILAKNINLDRNYKNVLNYTESQMLALVNENKIGESSFNSFIRQNGNSIATNFTYNQALQANYIAFQNPDYSQKWFFAWIDEIIYKNDSNIEIRYTIDAWSTWFEKLQLKNCFIVREHVSDDTIGANTVPEDLSTGEMISDWVRTPNIFGSESYFWLVCASNWEPAFGGVTAGRYAQSWIYGGYPQASAWFAWAINWNNPSDLQSFNDWLQQVTIEQHADDIQAVFALPYDAFNLTGDIDPDTHKVLNGKGIKYNEDYNIPIDVMHSFIDTDTSETIPVKNNKLYCYPYNFLRVTNNSGSFNDYYIEDFAPDVLGNYGFNCVGVPCIGYSGKIRPKNYRGVTLNEDESLALGKYPTLSWATDAYINWLTQNAVNMAVNAIGGSATSAVAFATGHVVTGTLSVAGLIGNSIGQIEKASQLPNTAQGNANQGDVSFAFNLIRFKFQKIRPKKEYIQMLDSYFTRFGYKVNRLGTPNLTSRQYWNYVEIGQGEQVGYGEIPSMFLQKINNAFESGVTVWHNHSNIGNYELNNSIV